MAGKWKEEERKRQREIIIEKALEIFAQKGFKKTKMQDIADESGFSKGLLYLHFKTKEDLYTSVLIKIYYDTLIKPQDKEIFNEIFSPDEKIRKMAYSVLEIYDKYPEMISMVGALSRTDFQNKLSEDIKKEVSFFSKKGKERFVNIIKEGVKKGLYKKNLEYTKVGALFFTALHGVMFFYNDHLKYHFLKDSPYDSLKEYYDLMINILIDGIKEQGE